MTCSAVAFTSSLLLLGATCQLSVAAETAPATPLKVLLLSGRNNHDFKSTTPELVKILQEDGLCAVDITDDPTSVEACRLRQYDVIVSNWTAWPEHKARPWGAEFEKTFLECIRAGKGFVLFHAASTCFAEWPEYHQMVGATWGLGTTGHGRVHEFRVNILERDHPITRGMSDFLITDELWHRTVSLEPSTEKRILCMAFSAKENGGSGQSEPVALSTRFGKGRCFHLVLGHDVRAMRSTGWRMLMRRGTQWAATGKVTLALPASPKSEATVGR